MQRGVRIRLQVIGGSFERDGFAFYWPIWKDPTSLVGVKALLSHSALRNGPSALGHLGVLQVLRTRRISVGKFMNFTRAESVDVISAAASPRPQ